MYTHGITFGGHPVHVRDRAQEHRDHEARADRRARARDSEDVFRAKLETLLDLPIVGDVRGTGFFYALELVKDKETTRDVRRRRVRDAAARLPLAGALRRGPHLPRRRPRRPRRPDLAAARRGRGGDGRDRRHPRRRARARRRSERPWRTSGVVTRRRVTACAGASPERGGSGYPHHASCCGLRADLRTRTTGQRGEARWRARTEPSSSRATSRGATAQGDTAVDALRGVSVEIARGQADRRDGAVGVGQVDADAHPRRPRQADLRHRHDRGHRDHDARRHRPDEAAARAHRLRLPVLQPAADADRARRTSCCR